jgi:hypothetical protein
LNISSLRATPGAPRRAARFAATLVATTLLVATSVAGADAASPKAVGGPRALAVSVPPDPVPINAGTSSKTLIRVVNPNDAPVKVTISSRTLSLGNNGKVSIGTGPDPRWDTFVKFPAGVVTIPAQSYVNIPLTVRVPADLRPDLYFVGFLVSPLPTASGSLQVINQIGSFITVDVPGPRIRKLLALFNVPSLVLGSHVSGTLRIANVGHTAVRFWGENDTTSSPGGSFEQQRLNASLLPSDRSRFFTVSGKPAWPVGLVRMTVHVIYPGRTDSTTKELTFSKQVIVVSPVVPEGVATLLVAILLFWVTRRRRRRRRPLLAPALLGS